VSFTDQHPPIDSDAVPSGQREVRPTPHAGSEKVTADFAKLEAPLEGRPVVNAIAQTAPVLMMKFLRFWLMGGSPRTC